MQHIYYIDGITDVLNKIYLKLPEKQIKFIIAEANDLKDLGGYFKINFITGLIEFKETPINNKRTIWGPRSDNYYDKIEMKKQLRTPNSKL